MVWNLPSYGVWQETIFHEACSVFRAVDVSQASWGPKQLQKNCMMQNGKVDQRSFWCTGVGCFLCRDLCTKSVIIDPCCIILALGFRVVKVASRLEEVSACQASRPYHHQQHGMRWWKSAESPPGCPCHDKHLQPARYLEHRFRSESFFAFKLESQTAKPLCRGKPKQKDYIYIYICDFRAQDPEAPQSRLPSRTYSWLALLLLTQWWLKCLYRTRTAYLEHPTSAKHCVPCHESLPNATKGANLIVFIDWEDSELFHPMFLPNGGPSHSSLPTYSKTRSHAQRTALDVESLSGPVADHQFVEGWKAATFPRLCTCSEVFRREWHWSLKLVVEPSAHKEA